MGKKKPKGGKVYLGSARLARSKMLSIQVKLLPKETKVPNVDIRSESFHYSYRYYQDCPNRCPHKNPNSRSQENR
jgi:hypothetical protein